MELLLLITIVCIVLFFVLKKPRPSSKDFPVGSPEWKDSIASEVKNSLERPDIIEDSSHLKADLVATKEALSQVQQQLGRVNFEYQQIFFELQTTCASHEQLSEDYDRLHSQKKSGEVRLGHVSEQLLPMLPEFPVPINTLKFFGNPIDYISVDIENEWISFIEVKSGGAVLSDKQKKIRKMIEDKKVRFYEVRIDDKGVKVK